MGSFTHSEGNFEIVSLDLDWLNMLLDSFHLNFFFFFFFFLANSVLFSFQNLFFPLIFFCVFYRVDYCVIHVTVTFVHIFFFFCILNDQWLCHGSEGKKCNKSCILSL